MSTDGFKITLARMAIWHVCFQISSVSRSLRMDSQSLLYVITRLTLQCIFLFSWNDSVYITILQKTNFKQNIIWNIRIGIYCVNQLVIISYESIKIVLPLLWLVMFSLNILWLYFMNFQNEYKLTINAIHMFWKVDRPEWILFKDVESIKLPTKDAADLMFLSSTNASVYLYILYKRIDKPSHASCICIIFWYYLIHLFDNSLWGTQLAVNHILYKIYLLPVSFS